MQRVVVTAKLKPGSNEAATELLRAGPQYNPGKIGLVRHGVYLGSSEVAFYLRVQTSRIGCVTS